HVAHSAVLYGMIILFLGTVVLTIEHDIVRIIAPDYQFYYGTFYLVYSFLMDVAGIAVVVGLIHLSRRRQKGPARLDYKRADGRDPEPARKRWIGEDKIFVRSLLLIIVTGYVMEGIRIVADDMPGFEKVSFIGYILALVFNIFTSEGAAEVLYVILWWFHMLLVTAWVAAIPYTKALHIAIDYVALVTVDELAGKRLPKQSADAKISGYGTVSDLTWRDLLALDACTKCGKCHISCPAQTVGQPLSPRDLILDIRLLASQEFGTNEITNRDGSGTMQQLIVLEENPTILPETIWSCTTCRACVTHCPVGIEHVPLIVNLRRRMVEEGEIDAGIQDVLEKTGKYGNSFGKSNRQRARWAKKMVPKVKDARKEEVDYLWFVGDFASFDVRAQEDTVSVAKIFNEAGVNFGILYEGEKTAGNDIRRVGEEGLFEMLVEDNLAEMSKANFDKIVTTDPHTLNTLRNEYPDFDSDFMNNNGQSIFHYTQILWEMIESGKIAIKKKASNGNTVTYHDPCYLGRYAEEYDAPRKIIQALGYELIDMPRCRENSFCCGAGGGMIWLGEERESTDGDRPAPNRIREAKALDVDKFVVACPKDKVMFGDAVKTVPGKKLQVIDIAQLLYEAMDIPEPEPEPDVTTTE
ncbi:MAG: heterodisulfide reductase-related iron-sulfur binding cluster, partial [Candidatus Kariarchaeaceae archaeon]